MNWGHRPAKWTLVAGSRLEASPAKAKLLDMDNCISVNLQQDYFKSSFDHQVVHSHNNVILMPYKSDTTTLCAVKMPTIAAYIGKHLS